MKRIMVLVLALIMVFAALPVVGAYAAEAEQKEMVEKAIPEELIAMDKIAITTRDVTNAEIAWVKQATGALVWAPDGDDRSDDEIIARAKSVDSSLTGGTDVFAVLRGFDYALTPNTHGSQAKVTVELKDNQSIMTIEGKFSHFDYIVKEATEEPVVADEKVQIRVDVPLKMAVAFEDGTVCYGGEMKEFVVGNEYMFQMCSVNWDNGTFDGIDNGIRGAVVYRMIAVHQDKFLEIAKLAKAEPEKYTVKGIDVIDNVEKTIYVNCDAEDTHLETDVNNFFMAYRFHFDAIEEFDLKTGIAKVVNTPVERLSVNLPLDSTVACKAYNGEENIDKADVFVANNSGKGIYEDEFLTSVNDFVWGQKAIEVFPIEVKEEYREVEYAK